MLYSVSAPSQPNLEKEATMVNKEEMYALLKQAAVGKGIRYNHASEEILNASDCKDYYAFDQRMWDVYRILRAGRLEQDVRSAMMMLDMSELSDEQPTTDPKQRMKIVRQYIQPKSLQLAWRRGLRDIVDHFEVVTDALDWERSRHSIRV